jgi:Tripartite tricarboxylate transporter family receptor
MNIHKTVKGLIARAKAKSGQLSYGSAGSGAINHLAGELFNMMAGTQLIHVPYQGGGPVVVALLSGEITLILIVRSALESMPRSHARSIIDSCLPGAIDLFGRDSNEQVHCQSRPRTKNATAKKGGIHD